MDENQFKVPPHSIEAERAILGSILLDVSSGGASRVLDLCTENGLTEESFFSPPLRKIFAAMSAMQKNNLTIDALTLNEHLRREGLLAEIGGPRAIQELLDETPTAAHSEYYIGMVRKKHLLRKVIECARDAEKRCFDESAEADLILGQVEQNFLGISENRGNSGMTWPQAITSTISHIDRLFQQGKGAMAGLPSGFANLDRTMRGLRPAEMIVLAARPSMGKTSLAMNIAECVALGRDIYGRPMAGDHNRKHPVAVFSLEMSTESLAMRMLCGLAGRPSFQLEQAVGNPQEVNRDLTRAASELSKAPIYVDDTGGLDVMDMRARARRLKKRYGIELIVIDYLQLCNCREFARQGRQIEISQVSGHIKAMAKELNVPVIVLSQLSRAPEQRGDRSNKPKLSDLRDSGAIEQDADVALLLRRPCKIPSDEEHDDYRLAIVDVAKHRNGPTGEVRLDFDDKLTRFGDRANDITAADVDAEPVTDSVT